MRFLKTLWKKEKLLVTILKNNDKNKNSNINKTDHDAKFRSETNRLLFIENIIIDISGREEHKKKIYSRMRLARNLFCIQLLMNSSLRAKLCYAKRMLKKKVNVQHLH